MLITSGEIKMSNTATKKQKVSLEDLQQELEVRYGPALAQEIIDQIKKTEDQGVVLSFMLIQHQLYGRQRSRLRLKHLSLVQSLLQ